MPIEEQIHEDGYASFSVSEGDDTGPILTPLEISQLREKAIEKERKEQEKITRLPSVKLGDKVPERPPQTELAREENSEACLALEQTQLSRQQNNVVLPDDIDDSESTEGAVSVTEIYDLRRQATEMEAKNRGRAVPLRDGYLPTKALPPALESEEHTHRVPSLSNTALTRPDDSIGRSDARNEICGQQTSRRISNSSLEPLPSKRSLYPRIPIETEGTQPDKPRSIDGDSENHIPCNVSVVTSDEETGSTGMFLVPQIIEAAPIEPGAEREKILRSIIQQVPEAELVKEDDDHYCKKLSYHETMLYVSLILLAIFGIGLGVGMKGDNRAAPTTGIDDLLLEDANRSRPPSASLSPTSAPSPSPTETSCPCFSEETLFTWNETTPERQCTLGPRFALAFGAEETGAEIIFCTGVDCPLLTRGLGVNVVADRMCMTLTPTDALDGDVEYTEINEAEDLVCRHHMFSYCPPVAV